MSLLRISTVQPQILFDGKRAVGVRFVREGGFTYEVLAEKEVIISSGAINSPHLLLLSGIGPKEELQKHGIPMIAELPVGLNYQDHSTVFRNVFFENLKISKEEHFYKRNLLTTKAMIDYFIKGEGPLTTAAGQALCFFDADEEGNYILTNKMPEMQIFMAGAPFIDDPDDEVITRFNKFANFGPSFLETMKNADKRQGIMLAINVLHPRSRGSISLASADPLQRPVIDPNILGDPEDQHKMKIGLKFISDVLKSPTMTSLGSYFIETKFPTKDRIAPDVDPESEEYLEKLVSTACTVCWHPAGSCKMGAEGDTSAVVDPQLRVQGGIQGLRVVDNSIMPHLTSGNTNAPAIMIGEKGSDLILQSYR
ncbi:hypothetical protein EB796_014241 [Bugula neritina]|uniref:Glucose-methanol-choline oxidoreductase N-terminal domain-containing protein n=1 Tax=Bugula neritina TaxID=10212 RepID=A0A7J7JM49_BUGNE|nr:hypothetical protein EB796_014241 [Bugula neritina]